MILVAMSRFLHSIWYDATMLWKKAAEKKTEIMHLCAALFPICNCNLWKSYKQLLGLLS